MNKLFILGNGFDLAHKLPTSYKDFINDFWTNLKFNKSKDYIKDLVFVNDLYDGYFDYNGNKIYSFKDFWSNIKNYSDEYQYRYIENLFEVVSEVKENQKREKIFYFKNTFFRKISQKTDTNNWVDIEREYFNELKKLVLRDNLSSKNEEEFKSEKKDQVTKLNKEFDEVKNLLKVYLQRKIDEVYDFQKPLNDQAFKDFCTILEPTVVVKNYDQGNKLQEFSKEFSFKEDKEAIDKSYLNFDPELQGNRRIYANHYVSFNYTKTLSKYVNFVNRKYSPENDFYVNYIHGQHEEDIIFGYGDESDISYKRIEDIDENNFLDNFKSFQYSENLNYDKLISFIESDKYQVIVLGHSCGLSDRLLLKTVFEHKNCRSIKVYFYQKENSTEDKVSDNFREIVQNISRHFEDKSLMRIKLVNKKLSSPFPQNLRFGKK